MKTTLLLLVGVFLGTSGMGAADDGQKSITIQVEPVAPAPIRFAAEELSKYLRMATGKSVTEMPTDASHDENHGIRIGEASCFPNITLPPVPDPVLDDAIYIEVKQGEGIIVGNNPRSTLLAVYRYLYEAGFRWVRPGADGEQIPPLTALPDVSIHESASYRHRGVCIEGINSVEHIQALIDWLPKLGFNTYFIQFEQGYTFFDRWYTHDLNPNIKGDHPSVEQVDGFVARIESDIRKRGMLYHKVGHGWTCLPFGIRATGWETSPEPPHAEIAPFLAEINGIRQFSENTPLNTNLCYSNPEVRRRMCAYIADYAQQHPWVDYLHVWLADGWNNHCECAHCRPKRPSDWYLTLLNELDQELSRRAITTRIVFLIYVDLLWPPKTEQLAHPGRFALMFAPYTRSYDKSYQPDKVNPDLPPFTLNQLKMPATANDNVSFLRAWQNLFKGDSFDYDYHFFEQYKNLGQMGLARVIYEDMKNLEKLGLNGNVSCQPQRTFFPTGLLMTIMGRTLWNRTIDYDTMVDQYFADSFGADGPICRRYLESITSLYHPEILQRKDSESGAHEEDLRRIPALIDGITPNIIRNAYLEDPCRARSWQILRQHADFTRLFVEAVILKREEKAEAAAQSWRKAEQFLWAQEPSLQNVFDVCGFVEVVRPCFAVKEYTKNE